MTMTKTETTTDLLSIDCRQSIVDLLRSIGCRADRDAAIVQTDAGDEILDAPRWLLDAIDETCPLCIASGIEGQIIHAGEGIDTADCCADCRDAIATNEWWTE